jgi:undecaprenyl-phosphate galactose phosphotransferase
MRLFLLFIADSVAFLLAFLLAYCLRILFSTYDKTIIQTFISIWWAAPIIMLSFAYEGLYVKRRPFWMEVRFILRSLTLAFLLIFTIVSLGHLSSDISRFILVAFGIFCIFLLPIMRKYAKRFTTGLEPVVIIGSNKAAIACAEALLEDRYLGYKFIGFLADNVGQTITVRKKEFKVLGKAKNIGRFVSIGVKTAIVALHSNEESLRVIGQLHSKVKRIFFAPDAHGAPLANTEPLFLFEKDIFLLGMRNNLESEFSQFAKRAFDILLSIVAVPILMPIIAIIAFLIKKDDGGTVFFVQTRMGQDGKPFSCYKFRTMKSNSGKILDEYLKANIEAKIEWEKYKKIRGTDPRVTKIGQFLRKTSLDELPQIFNIIKGEMSFVGPRPYLFSERKDMLGQDGIVLICKPGISGFWQISGRNQLDFSERVRLDSWYVANWSLWLDVVILIKTVKVVLKQEGAY